MNNTDDPDHTFFKLMFGIAASGVNVNASTAIRSSVVWRAVTLLSGTVASLPFPVYKRLQPRGKERSQDHELYYKLHTRPNPEIASNVWRLMGVANQLLWGNWYSEIAYKDNRPFELWPIPPWRVRPLRGKDGFLYYEVRLPDQSVKKIPDWGMLHVKNLYMDGDEGISCIKAACNSVGLGLAAETFASKFYNNGANLGGIVEYPAKLSEAARDNFIQSVKEGYQGLGGSHRLMLLEEGLKYHRTAIPPNEGQFIESRKFQVADIGRFFFITQLHKLGDLEKSSFNNIEHQSIEFVTDTIQPLLVNIEQEINHKLFYAAGDNEHFAEFLIAGLLRGDTETRNKAYSIGRQWGWLSANDIRELENLNPLPGKQGDIYLIPMNMIPADQVDDYEPKPLQGKPKLVDKNAVGEKEYRSGLSRLRIADSYKRVFNDAAARIVKREEADVMRKARELLGERSNQQAFLSWLKEFYETKHYDYIRKQMQPPLMSLAEAIKAELGIEINSNTEMTPELEKFVSDYLANYIKNHIKSSLEQLTFVANKSFEENVELLEALQERFDEWNERRPDKIATRETVQLHGAIARFVFASEGVTELVWYNTGSNVCEFCQGLHGKVVGIENPFIPANTSISGLDGAGNSLTINGPKFHPPIHQSCRCVIGPK